MKSLIAASTLSLSLVAAATAQATLIDRGGGLIYDTAFDITWLADANYAETSGFDADGAMSWSDAMSWAGNLSYGGLTDWRLPVNPQSDPACSFHYSDGNGPNGSPKAKRHPVAGSGTSGTSPSRTAHAWKVLGILTNTDWLSPPLPLAKRYPNTMAVSGAYSVPDQ